MHGARGNQRFAQGDPPRLRPPGTNGGTLHVAPAPQWSPALSHRRHCPPTSQCSLPMPSTATSTPSAAQAVTSLASADSLKAPRRQLRACTCGQQPRGPDGPPPSPSYRPRARRSRASMAIGSSTRGVPRGSHRHRATMAAGTPADLRTMSSRHCTNKETRRSTEQLSDGGLRSAQRRGGMGTGAPPGRGSTCPTVRGVRGARA